MIEISPCEWEASLSPQNVDVTFGELIFILAESLGDMKYLRVTEMLAPHFRHAELHARDEMWWKQGGRCEIPPFLLMSSVEFGGGSRRQNSALNFRYCVCIVCCSRLVRCTSCCHRFRNKGEKRGIVATFFLWRLWQLSRLPDPSSRSRSFPPPSWSENARKGNLQLDLRLQGLPL